MFKLKPAVWERHGNHLYVMSDHREMRTLSDPDGRIEELLRLLSSDAHSAETLAAELAQRFPDVSAEDVQQGISGLDELGMIENAAMTDLMSPWQQERYFTNLVFFQSFATLALSKEEMQQRLLDADVLVLGVGGVGSMVLMHLVGAGVGKFTILDHDIVEERNFSRQFVYRHADIGRAKVERAREWVSEYSPGTKVRALNQEITSWQDVAELLDGTDLVVAAMDTPRFLIASWVNQACVAAGVPYVHGGMGVQSGYASVDPGRSACFECNRLVMLGERGEPGEIGAKWRLFHRLSLGNRGVGPIAGQIGALMAMEALRYLTGFSEPVAAGVFRTFDLSQGGAETVTPWVKRSDCPACSMVGTAAGHPPSRRVWQRETAS